jgi:hypothetical protein
MSPAEIEAQLRQLLENPSTIAEMSRKSREIAMVMFGESNAKVIERSYQTGIEQN